MAGDFESNRCLDGGKDGLVQVDAIEFDQERKNNELFLPGEKAVAKFKINQSSPSFPFVKTPKNRVSSAKGVHLAGILLPVTKTEKCTRCVPVSRDTRYEVKTRVGVGTNC